MTCCLQVDKRIPALQFRLRRDVLRIEREEVAHGSIITEDRRDVNIAARELGVRSQDRLSALQCSMPDDGIDEVYAGIVCLWYLVHLSLLASYSLPKK